MNRATLSGVASAAILVSSAGYAAQDAPNTAAAADDLDTSETVVCRQMPPPAGSRIGRRNVCKTEMEWSVIDRENGTMMDQAFNRSKMQDNEFPN